MLPYYLVPEFFSPPNRVLLQGVFSNKDRCMLLLSESIFSRRSIACHEYFRGSSPALYLRGRAQLMPSSRGSDDLNQIFMDGSGSLDL
ncbi:hypothetical protein CDAR_528521 [Caerostris darwini]|uniref:Ycf15 n=1 Tax=Caerostris darwini TaxID=1538125 RepID=A0AAV4P3K8_9ARAC|nr:hypothetical protein CDAR_528521 [Caerostris darwini]